MKVPTRLHFHTLDPHDSDIGGIFEIVVEMTNRTMNNQESWEVV
jgi:hypothetical protein